MGAAKLKGKGVKRAADSKAEKTKKNAAGLVKKKAKEPRGRVRRILKKKEPQPFELIKKSIFMRGPKTSEVVSELLRDMYALNKPEAKLLSKKNQLYPFEDSSSIEFLTSKNDCSLFAIGSHTKKRPNNITMGRTFDGHVFDMVEFGVSDFRGLDDFTDVKKKAIGSKPMFIFQGDMWEQNDSMSKIKSLFLDFFRGLQVSEVALAGLDHVIVATAAGAGAQPGSEGAAAAAAAAGRELPEIINFRTYAVLLKKSGTSTPRVELSPMGPCMELQPRRSQFASADLRKLASRRAKSLGERKVKNVRRNELGDKLGQVHLGRQQLDGMQFKKMRALRPSADEKKASRTAAKLARKAKGSASGERTAIEE